MTTTDGDFLRCFIVMPMTVTPEHATLHGDDEHWPHLMNSFFIPAIKSAGLRPVPPAAIGAQVIHQHVVSELAAADMVLCDISSQNANVFFELGVRTALNLPVTLVADEHTDLPFDVGTIAVWRYSLKWHNVEAQISALAAHLRNSYDTCGGQNPFWRAFGTRARRPIPTRSFESATHVAGTDPHLTRGIASDLITSVCRILGTDQVRGITIDGTTVAVYMRNPVADDALCLARTYVEVRNHNLVLM